MSAGSSRLLIVACSRSKRTEEHLLPAIDRYDGPVFQVLRRYLRVQPDMVPDIYILSAKYGLISSQRPIPLYDERMTRQRAHELRPDICAKLREISANRLWRQIYLSAGQSYLHALEGYESAVPDGCEVRCSSGSLGKHQADLRSWLYGTASVEQTDLPPDDAPKTFRLRGSEFIATRSQALDVAHRAVHAGIQAAMRCQAWYVPVGSERVAPKWLVSQLAGLPVSAFHSQEARRILSQLGVEVSCQ